MPSYQMDFKTFLTEVKRFKLTQESLFRIKMSEDKEFYTFCFCVPNTSEEYVSVIRKEDISQVQMMDLIPITIKATRISETMKAAQVISNKIQEVEDAKQSIPIIRENT